MKVQLSWFKDYVDIDGINVKDFCDAMTMSGTLVEGIEEQGKNIENVVVGKILKIEKHPDADKLVVCQVDVGTEVIQIVTGATNVFEGAVIPVAKDGAILPECKIKTGKLRGVTSCGMMCSDEELGIATKPATGILILEDKYELGMDIREALGINDTIIEFEITPNRVDCFSVIGIAREVAATFDKPFNLKKPLVKEVNDNINNYVDVKVLDNDLCSRYCSRVVKNVRIKESPEWLKRRLENSGIRAINNIVDITNYVMLEYGQPMHSFDLRDLNDGKIIVRKANANEEMTTLDGVERKLDDKMLVIADTKGPVAIAGIMGGENSEVKDDTTTIVFESAAFNGASIRTSAKRLGMRTEASAIYEKGLNPHNSIDAINRACELVNILDAGDVVEGIIDVHKELGTNNIVKFNPEKINKFLGTNIDKAFMEKAFSNLEIELKGDDLIIPFFRPDIEGEADIAEEVARIYGYNNIPTTLIRGEATVGIKNEKQKTEDSVKNSLNSLGFYEIMTYSWNSPKVYEKLNLPVDDYIKILNPLGEDQSVMRTTVIGSMLEIVATNYNYRNENAKLFEIGTKYLKEEGNELANEKQDIVISMYGDDVDYYSIKGVVEKLFKDFGISYYEIEREENNPVFHPGQTANMLLRRKKAVTLGKIHPSILKNFGIGTDVYMAVISFDAIMENQKTNKTYKKLPKFPAITRDIAVVVDEDVPVRALEDVFQKCRAHIMESYKLFDVYKSALIGEGKKSVAYSLVFRSADKTLKDDDVNAVMDDILKKLGDKFDAKLREC